MNLFHFWPIPIFDIAYLHCKGERERDKIERKKRQTGRERETEGRVFLEVGRWKERNREREERERKKQRQIKRETERGKRWKAKEDEKKGDIDFFLSYIKGGNCTHISSQFLVLFPLLSSHKGAFAFASKFDYCSLLQSHQHKQFEYSVSCNSLLVHSQILCIIFRSFFSSQQVKLCSWVQAYIAQTRKTSLRSTHHTVTKHQWLVPTKIDGDI